MGARATLSLALMAVLEKLSALERAAFMLHEVFAYEHAEVAAMIERDEGAARQLVYRARAHLADVRVRFAPSREAHARMLLGFLLAMAADDAEALARRTSRVSGAASRGCGATAMHARR